jgi:hypothetical protein
VALKYRPKHALENKGYNFAANNFAANLIRELFVHSNTKQEIDKK